MSGSQDPGPEVTTDRETGDETSSGCEGTSGVPVLVGGDSRGETCVSIKKGLPSSNGETGKIVVLGNSDPYVSVD